MRALEEEELDPKTKRSNEIKRDVDAKYLNFLRGLKMLQRLRRNDDPLGEKKAYDLISPILWKEQQPPNEARLALMRRSLVSSLAHALRDVRLVFWLSGKGDGQRLLPGLYCPDLKTAITVKWLMGSRIRVCLHCQSIFLARRPKQECCKQECTEAHRLARWRAARKGKHGPHKTR